MRLVWHRSDLRVHDHPALQHALAQGPVIGLTILDPTILDVASARRKAWFVANLTALRDAYQRRGGVLLVRTGAPQDWIPRLAHELHVEAIHALASYTPYGRKRDRLVAASTPIPIHWHEGTYIHEPGTIQRDDGIGYSVYTPYFKRWSAAGLPAAMASPSRLTLEVSTPEVSALELGEIPQFESDVTLPSAGEEAARDALEEFMNHRLAQYATDRDRLDGSGSSGLSIYLNLGVLSPRLAALRAAASGAAGAAKFIAELAWRDFMADLLWQRPELLTEPFDSRWQRMVWTDDQALFEAWLLGRTGFPVIDAAMRELNATGRISNRARMLVAQFASKLLLLPWTRCEREFKNLLLDGDTAQNVGGWQWSCGLGVDAAPYFRVFNSVTQGAQHDPSGSWIRRWVPESGGSPQPMKQAVIDAGKARQRYLDLAGELARNKAPKRG
jgi:deoxyribodipyrimidine photo-lyase